jgi:hypothetical protein
MKFAKPFAIFADWDAGATQVKWNRQDPNIIASSHDRFLRIWDRRKGAIPLKTITAHSTKIYGIDWNRTRSTGILTCSLDKTIKLWDYSKGDSDFDTDDSHAERVFRTPYPVWRARHTPFGWGVLAMPQRGNYNLHLYDRRLSTGIKRKAVVPPTHSFEGHLDCVKEFLWRTRGSIEDGIDNRDFQLVSWGTDRYLHLHKMNPKILKSVGFEKGKEVFKKPTLTREGAVYMTYTDGPVKLDASTVSKKMPGGDSSQTKGNLSTLFQASQFQKNASASPLETAGQPAMIAPVGMRVKHRGRKIVNTIKWMEGVKIGNRDTDNAAKWETRGTILPPPNQYTWDSPECLGDEITYVGGKYRKVAFEEVDVVRRKATVSLYGPWGLDRKPAFIRISFKFSPNYPRESAPDLTIEKTTAAIADDTLLTLDSEMRSLAELYLNRKRGSLEAIVGYALGERGLEESIDFLELEDQSDVRGLDRIPDEESSSDEEDDDLKDLKVDFEGAVDLERSGNDIPVNTKANVPLPKQCGAMWSEDGRLVCFFRPPPDPKPMFTSVLRPDRLGRSWSIFDTFGRLNAPSAPGTAPGTGDEDQGSLHESWTSSSSTSSSSRSDGDDVNQGRRFQPPAAWRRAALKFQKSSQVSTSGQGDPIKPKSIVSIKEVEEHLLPCKKVLAKEYKIFGDGPTVCAHNAEVARKHGFEDLAEVWDICKLILRNDVPLEVLPQQYRREQVLVLARRSMVKIRRKDSGIDLAFDDPEKVAKPKLTGRVKWGRHPVATFMIPAFFDHFEALADTQMLAMLSCIFSEPAANEGVTAAMQRLRQSDLPMSMEAPAFSLDYFSSPEAAWSLFRPPQSIPGTPSYSQTRFSTPVNSWDRLDKRLDTYGSAGSSNGPWGSDPVSSDPATPYSTGHTPPILSRTSTHRSLASATASYSTSPEQQHQAKRSGSNLATAFATLSRPFSITASSSPPVNPKQRGEGDLSTSAPTSGITWGTNTFYSSSNATNATGRSKYSKRPSVSQLDGNYLSHHSEEDEDPDWPEDGSSEPALPMREADGNTAIRVTLKNQDQFDDEGCLSAPLLDRSKEGLYRHYREQYAEQLSIWNLIMQRAEILKFNGLVSYWPEKKTERPPTKQDPPLEVRDFPPTQDQQASIQRPERPALDRGTSNDSLFKQLMNLHLNPQKARSLPTREQSPHDFSHPSLIFTPLLSFDLEGSASQFHTPRSLSPLSTLSDLEWQDTNHC